MRSKEDIEALAYDIWLAISAGTPQASLLAITGGGSMLALLLWVLGEAAPGNELLDLATRRGHKTIDEDCLDEVPIQRISKDLMSRQDGARKAANSVNN